MPPRPFPLALNIGTDVCHTARFKKYFIQHPTYRHSGLFRLFDKFLLPSEQKAFWKRFPLGKEVEGSDGEVYAGEVEGKEEVGERQMEGLVRKVAQREEQKATTKEPAIWDTESRKACVDYIGGRWAAKEAIIKAYAPKRRLLLRDIEIRRNSTTREPYGIVLDTPPPSRKGLSSAKFIYKAILEKEALTRPSTLPIEHQQRSSGQMIEQQQQQASRILSDEGILDLNAVTAALNHPSTSTSPSPTPNLIKKHPARETETSTATDKAMKLQMENAKEALELVDVQGEIVKVSISHDGEYCVATALAAL
ncbi:hypothetical protein M438DRAFT_129869 [Aureobasidium pullulans EXF-150]|uniref:4'-phosphopantetheinyl transferase domain-containing protein n=1 Tax=Aureobasidium pullulans EXF-150 TaxID=1043002 RepID=A0A074XQA5_AURPU|nr:uncharacterized protein M438DRAFT_129869 [Aureobasidium pullulans EXF-150]KEQ87665.1 hypothetical protein M438DRAFT_129869 [Aureobasidium pullulans EXF-150]